MSRPAAGPAAERGGRVAFFRSLGGRLLLLTVLFVLVAEVLIFVPSIARFRLVYLHQRIDAGMLAALALEAAPGGAVEEALARRLLAHARVDAVALRTADRSTMLLSPDPLPPAEASYDLRGAAPAALVADAFRVLLRGPRGAVRVLAESRIEPGAEIEVVLGEADLRREMAAVSLRILELSIVISLLVAASIYFSLHRALVRPMRAMAANMARFRRRPEDAAAQLPPSRRGDEIGAAQTALRAMERDIRRSLLQKTRLAALGAAMSKINHDLRNILASAMAVSDGLEASADPRVRKTAPRLMAALDRAVELCGRTLDYAQFDEPEFRPEPLALGPLVEEVRDAMAMDSGGGGANAVTWEIGVPAGLVVSADRLQLFRAIQNVARNAVEAMPGGGRLRIHAAAFGDCVEIDIADDGPGVPERARAGLFEPFAGSARPGGVGLGLAIARENMRMHGGDIALASNGPRGARFRLALPRRGAPAAAP